VAAAIIKSANDEHTYSGSMRYYCRYIATFPWCFLTSCELIVKSTLLLQCFLSPIVQINISRIEATDLTISIVSPPDESFQLNSPIECEKNKRYFMFES
jgi:hypothetical protein